MTVDEVVHLRHSLDGYPLCWPMDREGEFAGSYDEEEVNCAECLKYLGES